MNLAEKNCNQRHDCQKLLDNLKALLITDKIKLISGSFNTNGYSVIEATFKEKGETQVWMISGVMDQHGGLTLKKVS